MSLCSIDVFAKNVDLSGPELLRQYVLEDNIVQETNTSTLLSVEDESSINSMYLQSYIESSEIAKQTYGGCYIDVDGKLHALFTNYVSDDVLNDVNLITENKIEIENCKYSLETLTVLKEHIGDIMTMDFENVKLSEIANDVVAVGINIEENKLVVRLKECSESKIDAFKNLISNFDAIEFKNSDAVQVQSSLEGGSQIEITTSGKGREYSVGFRCKCLNSSGSYVTGFMTAAHNNSAGDSVYNNNTYIGYIMARGYNNGGKIDCSFVYVTNSDYVPSNQLLGGAGTLVAGAYIGNYTVGNTVYLAGASSIYLSGKITDTSMIAECDTGYVINDCVEVNYVCKSGDSGGVVYKKSSGSNYVIGLNMGTVQSTSSVFIKITNIKNAFNIVLY